LAIGVDLVADASRYHLTEAGVAVVTKKAIERTAGLVQNTSQT
jgi:hypothetical protein